MLSRTLRRALLDPRYQLPPTFLLPWTAGLTTVSHTVESGNLPPLRSARDQQAARFETESEQSEDIIDAPLPPSRPSSKTQPVSLSDSVRELLPLLRAQHQHYITAHIHGKAYLITQGDTVRLPFLIKDVEPGDVLRLNCALNLGSRDFTLKAGAAPAKLKSATRSTTTILDPTSGHLASESNVMMPEHNPSPSGSLVSAPHFVPHIAKDKFSYLDDRLFVCRAVVMGVESEPMRVLEKTKRRQRHVKHVVSKHRYTILRIKELRIRSLEEIDRGEVD